MAFSNGDEPEAKAARDLLLVDKIVRLHTDGPTVAVEHLKLCQKHTQDAVVLCTR